MAATDLSDDIARAIVFLASDTSDYMTGVDLPVEGGRILGPHGMGMRDEV